MPRRELKYPRQVEDWLKELGQSMTVAGRLTLIGSGALLWHAAQRGIETPLPENSMDVDPITDSEEVARLCYEAVIGSDFERTHGWHVNLMPDSVLQDIPSGWEERASRQTYELLEVTVPSPADLLVPKLKRGEPRDHSHAAWAKSVNLV
jgi:hypothetical protein